MEDSQGRELCPPSITSQSLASPTGAYGRVRSGGRSSAGCSALSRYPATLPPSLPQECSPENAKTTYCTVLCQEGNAQVGWASHGL